MAKSPGLENRETWGTRSLFLLMIANKKKTKLDREPGHPACGVVFEITP